MKDVFDYVDKHAPEFVRDLQTLLRQPSISAQNKGVEDTARMVERMFSSVGARVQVLRIGGAAPLVTAEIPGAQERTLLFYNHYDVQPPEPLDAWRHDPFGAEIDGGRIYARGAADNKGDLAARVRAAEAFIKVRGELPVTLKFVVEGEEEIGSPTLDRYAKEHPEAFRADACVWETGSRDEEGRLEVTLGCKGLCYAHIEVEGGSHDLHSSLAAVAPNPAWRLVWALSSLKNEREEILIPGFYEDVQQPNQAEIELVEKLTTSSDRLARSFGINGFVLGLAGKDVLRRLYFEPTCNVCGLSSGYEGPGSKTVLPSKAVAKLDMRLVPNQEPEDIARKFEAYLSAKGCGDFRVTWLGAERPVRTDPESRIVKVIKEAGLELTGKEPSLYPTSPGTGPMYQVAAQFGTPAVGVGVANPESRVHGPDENIRVSDFLEGVKFIALVLERFAG
ncbi:MAG: M20/M25/M40 family metallo-hydrolase [Firmicutes bacterium]|jgi:acetylornithine deacetylase/succinyl-diaminopimelate desuccinylase-like protein|nr:M20/M25/M40 family metallo-hydrolase [Bacillota bacterium]MDH7495657.1 M20/M25/M40 family metallo-hydrolase [Bacillota bacterium]